MHRGYRGNRVYEGYREDALLSLLSLQNKKNRPTFSAERFVAEILFLSRRLTTLSIQHMNRNSCNYYYTSLCCCLKSL